MSEDTVNSDPTRGRNEGDGDPSSIGGAETERPGDDGTLGRIDRYVLLRRLGGGGFGSVYLARDEVAGIEVAVKGLPPLIRHVPEELERVRENFALVQKLSHPHIAGLRVLHRAESVEYYDNETGEGLRVSRGDYLVVMEFVPGVTLSEWRRQFPGKKVPFETAAEVARQIGEALDYAHSQRIVHRDIKPSNVMVTTKDDGSYTCKVLDFGLAAEIRSSMSRVSTEPGDTSGTRPYMAPEQWGGKPQAGPTDQYALAVLVYELLSGAVPFASAFETNDTDIMRATVLQDPPAPAKELTKKQNTALLAALAKKSNERYPSCTGFVAALAGGDKSSPVLKVLLVLLVLLVAGWYGYGWWQEQVRADERRLALETAVDRAESAKASQQWDKVIAIENKSLPAAADREASFESLYLRLETLAGDAREARDTEEFASRQQPGVEQRLDEARAALEAGKLSDALESVMRVVKLHPDHVAAEELHQKIVQAVRRDDVLSAKDNAIKAWRLIKKTQGTEGFRRHLTVTAKRLASADASREQEEYGEAFEGYLAVTARCRHLTALERGRKAGERAREKAQQAKQAALDSNAPELAPEAFKTAQRLYGEASEMFSKGLGAGASLTKLAEQGKPFIQAAELWTKAQVAFARAGYGKGGGPQLELVRKRMSEAAEEAPWQTRRDLLIQAAGLLNAVPGQRREAEWVALEGDCREQLVRLVSDLYDSLHRWDMAGGADLSPGWREALAAACDAGAYGEIGDTLNGEAKRLAAACKTRIGTSRIRRAVAEFTAEGDAEHRHLLQLAENQWLKQRYGAAAKAYLDARRRIPIAPESLAQITASLRRLNSRKGLANVSLRNIPGRLEELSRAAKNGKERCLLLSAEAAGASGKWINTLQEQLESWHSILTGEEVCDDNGQFAQLQNKWEELREAVAADKPLGEYTSVVLYRAEEAKKAGVPLAACARFETEVFRLILPRCIKEVLADGRSRPALRYWGYRAVSTLGGDVVQACGTDSKLAGRIEKALLPTGFSAIDGERNHADGRSIPLEPAEQSAETNAWFGLFPQAAVNKSGMEFVFVPPGDFTMGTEGTPEFEWDGPAHKVSISRPFFLSRYEVRVGAYRRMKPKALVGVPAGAAVTGLSFAEVAAFMDWLNTSSGMPTVFPSDIDETDGNRATMRLQSESYRLPTEAEWEYACVAGRSEQAGCWLNRDGVCQAPGKSYRPNRLTAHFMIGNAAELVADWFAPYPSEAVRDPFVDREGAKQVTIRGKAALTRIARGGSFRHPDSQESRKALMHLRQLLDPAVPMPETVGFRLVVPLSIGRDSASGGILPSGGHVQP